MMEITDERETTSCKRKYAITRIVCSTIATIRARTRSEIVFKRPKTYSS